MKNLNEYIQESLLDDEDELVEKSDIILVEEFIKNNYNGQYKINKRPVNGKYQVTGDNIKVINKNITKLTNDLFEWTTVKGYFDCNNCSYLKSLEGAPKTCVEFYGGYCSSLESLEGAPKKCGHFYCNDCPLLKSLKGAPKKCDYFYCHYCISLETLEGAPKDCKYFTCTNCSALESLEGAPEKCIDFYCNYCSSLKSLKGIPKECTYFSCRYCGGEFTEDDIKKVCKVKEIFV